MARLHLILLFLSAQTGANIDCQTTLRGLELKSRLISDFLVLYSIMQELIIKLLAVAYGGVGIVNLIAYWPTIKDLFNKKPSANIPSYFLWTVTSGITLFYSLFVLNDLLFRLVSGVNFVCCALILFLCIRMKK